MDQSSYTITDKRARNAQPREPGVEDHLVAEAARKAREELLARQAAADDSTPVDSKRTSVLTAFVVYIEHDGATKATSELDSLADHAIERQATFADMYSACAHVQKDINALEQAHKTVAVLQAQVAATQQAMQNSKLAQRIMRP